MKSVSEFSESSGELKEEEMNEVKGGDGLADAANNLATSTTQGAAASGGDIMITIYGTFPGSIL
jgi:hypothetical protein